MVLFLQPLFFLIYLVFWYILCAPFWLTYLLVKCFVTSTSRAQLPAHVARQFAKRGMTSEAARWYLKARQDRHYESLVSFGLFGPRRNEIRLFFVSNRDKLPSELRDVLGNLLWTEALLTDKPSKSGELASDNPAIIELVTQLVDAAHRPKDADQIQKFHRLADECASAPGLVAALRQEFTYGQLEHKYKFEPVSSPVNPERAPATTIRVERGPCCLCGAVGDWNGLDAYAKVAFYYSRPAGGSGGTISWSYQRFIGWLRVLFCEKCVPQSVAEEWHNGRRRQAMYWAVGIPLVAIGLAACIWFGDDQGRGDDASNLKTVIGVLLGVAFLCATVAVIKSMVKYSTEQHGFPFYRMRASKFLDDEKDKLIAACNLSGSELRGIKGLQDVTPTANNVGFDIEPSQFKVVIRSNGDSNLAKGSNGVEWKVL
jgi:hypothetical protein